MPRRKQLNTAFMRAAQKASGFNPSNTNILLSTSAVFTQDLLNAINNRFNPSSTTADILLATTASFTQELLTAINNNSISRNLVTVTANYSMPVDISKVLVDATSNNITITLPDPSLSKGASYSISKIDNTSNKVTIVPHNTELILGATLFELLNSNDALRLITDGTNWYNGG